MSLQQALAQSTTKTSRALTRATRSLSSLARTTHQYTFGTFGVRCSPTHPHLYTSFVSKTCKLYYIPIPRRNRYPHTHIHTHKAK